MCPKEMHSAIPREQVWAWDREGAVRDLLQDQGPRLCHWAWHPFLTLSYISELCLSLWRVSHLLQTLAHEHVRAKCWVLTALGCGLSWQWGEAQLSSGHGRSLLKLNSMWSVCLTLMGTVCRECYSHASFLIACRSSMLWCCWFCWAPWRIRTSVTFQVRNWEVTYSSWMMPVSAGGKWRYSGIFKGRESGFQFFLLNHKYWFVGPYELIFNFPLFQIKPISICALPCVFSVEESK